MSLNTIRFSCTTLADKGKKGILRPDGNGYYEQVIGGLNVFNSAGDYYCYEGAKQLFQQSSSFMRRVKRGALRGEVGHPKRLPGQSLDAYANRIATIDERNVCSQFSEIWLDFENYKADNGTPIVAIMGKITPSGPHGDMLRRQYENGQENVCFSIRSFTDEYIGRGGTPIREVRTIITFDYVNEPGISIAEKYKSPGLECLTETVFTKEQLNRAFDDRKTLVGFGQESSRVSKQELFDAFGWTQPNAPVYTRW